MPNDNKTRKPIRHGDVLLVPVDKAPKDMKTVPRENGRVVLAHGEITGHCHAITDDRVELVSASGAAELEAMFLLVAPGEPVSLVHEEHNTIQVPPGDWEVRRLREYAPERSSYVQD